MKKLSIAHVFLLNGFVLSLIGCAGFIANNFAIHTGVTPILSGLLFIAFSFLLKRNARVVSLTGMTLAFLLAIAFLWPFLRNLQQEDVWGMLRIGIEMVFCLLTGICVYKNLPANGTA